ncbi:MAG: hypothetical protein ACQKBY_00640 [Verrucomicrobiales bacterium]
MSGCAFSEDAGRFSVKSALFVACGASTTRASRLDFPRKPTQPFYRLVSLIGIILGKEVLVSFGF